MPRGERFNSLTVLRGDRQSVRGTLRHGVTRLPGTRRRGLLINTLAAFLDVRNWHRSFDVFIESSSESFSKLSRSLNIPLVRMFLVQAAGKPERSPCVETAATELGHDVVALFREG